MKLHLGKRIVIGRHCRIASEVLIFDSPGHPTYPIARMAGLPTTDDEVKPVEIEDNVWIGRRAIIMPGVRIGQGSVVASGAVVMADVPPDTLVLGNPALYTKTNRSGVMSRWSVGDRSEDIHIQR